MQESASPFAFDRNLLVGRLNHLPHRSRVAFALACATRLRAGWRLYVAEKGVPRADLFDQKMEGLWNYLLLNGSQELGLGSHAELETLTPREPDVWDPYPIYAQEALSALIYALQAFQSGDTMYAAWAGQVSYEACDQPAVRQLKLQRGISGHEVRILQHPLIQSELGRQERDIRLLERSADNDAIRVVHAQAVSESSLGSDDIDQ